MEDKDIVAGNIGEFAAYDVAIKGGKLVLSQSLSLKAVLDAMAAKIGGPVPAEVASFLEKELGLS
jgi:hypothetical protein